MEAESSPTAEAQPPGARRAYDSPVRRRRSADTRARIVAAGAELAHSAHTWDWDELTFRAVAERAGVAESTVYRHFANERELHAAVMQRLQEDAGVVYAGISLDEVGPTAARVFASLASFVAPTGDDPAADPALTSADQARRAALVAAVDAAAPHCPPEHRTATAAILDVLWHPSAYQRLVQHWGLDHDGAVAAIQRAVEVMAANLPES